MFLQFFVTFTKAIDFSGYKIFLARWVQEAEGGMGIVEFYHIFSYRGQFNRGLSPFPMNTYNELSYQGETRRQRFFKENFLLNFVQFRVWENSFLWVQKKMQCLKVSFAHFLNNPIRHLQKTIKKKKFSMKNLCHPCKMHKNLL